VICRNLEILGMLFKMFLQSLLGPDWVEAKRKVGGPGLGAWMTCACSG